MLAAYLRGSSVRLVVLSACDSARADPTDSFAGVAPRLVQAGLPAVVAMQSFLPDPLAPVFTAAFYRALADGRPVDTAITPAGWRSSATRQQKPTGASRYSIWLPAMASCGKPTPRRHLSVRRLRRRPFSLLFRGR